MKKRKVKTPILIIAVYLLLNGLVWGCMKVYTKSYNTMNREQIKMLDIQMSERTGAELSVLNSRFNLDLSDIGNNNIILFSLYISTPEKVKTIIRIVSKAKNHAPLQFNSLLSS